MMQRGRKLMPKSSSKSWRVNTIEGLGAAVLHQLFKARHLISQKLMPDFHLVYSKHNNAKNIQKLITGWLAAQSSPKADFFHQSISPGTDTECSFEPQVGSTYIGLLELLKKKSKYSNVTALALFWHNLKTHTIGLNPFHFMIAN